jgi:hypothetical protein
VRRVALATLRVLPAITVATSAAPALGVPLVTQISGTLAHKSQIVINGSGFGSKASAAPLVWDDASGTSLLALWDGAWPNAMPSENTNYYSPMRGIDPPHGHDTRYIAGAHAQNTGFNSGYDVVVFKNISLPAFPFYIYASWYQRADNAWVFGGDNNYKTFAYSICCSPYEMPNNWYTAYGPPHPGSPTDSAQWVITDDGASLMNPDVNGHNAWWGTGVNPMGGRWSKVEVSVRVTNQTDGYVKVREDGHDVLSYAGPTDRYSGTRRTIGVGGYARMQGYSANWRYFADVYLDTTLARVVLADKPTLSLSTIIEAQIPSAWSDGSITATVNLGKFLTGQTAYLFVIDPTGTASVAGLPVAVGGTAATPSPPSAISVH